MAFTPPYYGDTWRDTLPSSSYMLTMKNTRSTLVGRGSDPFFKKKKPLQILIVAEQWDGLGVANFVSIMQKLVVAVFLWFFILFSSLLRSRESAPYTRSKTSEFYCFSTNISPCVFSPSVNGQNARHGDKGSTRTLWWMRLDWDDKSRWLQCKAPQRP